MTKKKRTGLRRADGNGHDSCDNDEEFVGYAAFLKDVKLRLGQTRVRASLAVNQELVLFYWQLGRDILRSQDEQGWGSKIIERLSRDLRLAFPEMTGLSVRNLKYTRAFAKAWADPEFVPQLVAQIPWGHIRSLIDKVKDPAARDWYVRNTLEHGWSRNTLELHIDRHLFQAQGGSQTTFSRTLPVPQSDLAQQLIKDPYKFDFLGIGREANEREIEHGLIRHMRDFLLELGVGFAFLGNQYRLSVGDEEFVVDLLFYHTRLRCYVVIELKAGKFRPEYAGKLNFYCSAVDDLLRHPDDQPTIGLLLCRKRDRVVAEYALRDITKPIGISNYHLSDELPETLKSSLPTTKELEEELSSEVESAQTLSESDETGP